MACGLPVIATPQGFAPEIIIDGFNGYIIEEESPHLWAEKIKIILDDSALAEKMGKAAQKVIKENYTLDIFFQRQWAIYEEFQPKIK